MRRTLFLSGVLLLGSAQAQAPAEERAVPIDLLGSSQQRLGVLRSKVLAAEDRVRQAEQQAKETGSRLEDARARNDEAMRELKSSRQEAAQARKLYDQESLAFERLRRGEAPGTKSAAGRP